MSEAVESTVTYEGHLPAWYGEIEQAWFPTAETTEEHGAYSFEGFQSLWDARRRYPETGAGAWEVLPVSSVQDPTIVVASALQFEECES